MACAMVCFEMVGRHTDLRVNLLELILDPCELLVGDLRDLDLVAVL